MTVAHFFEMKGGERGNTLVEWERGKNRKRLEHGHFGGNLHVLIERPAQIADIMWTWYTDCLVQQHVLDRFTEAGLTGFSSQPVHLNFKNRELKERLQGEDVHEFIVTGWGGMARPESGIVRVPHPEGLDHLVYSHLADPEKLIDLAAWDGSDFFIVWPMPKHIFVTEKAKEVIEHNRFGNCQFVPVEELHISRHLPEIGFSPGPLEWYFPADRAKRMSEAFGIR